MLLLYPYAFYLYGAMYGDSLFLLTAIGSFVLLERRHYWLAGLVGALATAGRPVGVAVAVGLVVRMLEMLAEQRALAGGRTVAPAHAPIGRRRAEPERADRDQPPGDVPAESAGHPIRTARLARAAARRSGRPLAGGRRAGLRAGTGRLVHLPVGRSSATRWPSSPCRRRPAGTRAAGRTPGSRWSTSARCCSGRWTSRSGPPRRR